VLWLVNFAASLAGLFVSLYVTIIHDDLRQNCIEPADLANSL